MRIGSAGRSHKRARELCRQRMINMRWSLGATYRVVSTVPPKSNSACIYNQPLNPCDADGSTAVVYRLIRSLHSGEVAIPERCAVGKI